MSSDPTLAPTPHQSPELLAKFSKANLTDTGNAVRLIRRHGHELRYVVKRGEWLVWDGTRWKPDDSGEVIRRAKDTVRQIYKEASATNDEDLRKAIAKHGCRSEGHQRIEAMIRLAWSEPGIAIQPAALDADPWLFNVQNGTIDLRTGRLRSHSPDDYITKMAGCKYLIDAACTRWEQFLTTIMHSDVGLIGYLKRCAGYSMTGSVREQKLFMPHGSGANGKSTALGTLRKMMGDYACQAAPDLLLVRRGDNHPTTIADLEGVRFVLGIETDEGRRLAEALVKQMTGGDAMKGRKMHRDYSQFDPQFKLWLAVNHLPVVRGTDHAIWRRIQRIPFTVTIPDSEQDKELAARLADELPGVLNWCLAGCLEWQAQGLDEPTTITAATTEYREDMDIMGSFIESMFEHDVSGKISKKEFYTAYSEWSQENGEEVMSQRLVSYKLTERGIASERTKQGHYWKGLKRVTQEPG